MAVGLRRNARDWERIDGSRGVRRAPVPALRAAQPRVSDLRRGPAAAAIGAPAGRDGPHPARLSRAGSRGVVTPRPHRPRARVRRADRAAHRAHGHAAHRVRHRAHARPGSTHQLPRRADLSRQSGVLLPALRVQPGDARHAAVPGGVGGGRGVCRGPERGGGLCAGDRRPRGRRRRDRPPERADGRVELRGGRRRCGAARTQGRGARRVRAGGRAASSCSTCGCWSTRRRRATTSARPSGPASTGSSTAWSCRPRDATIPSPGRACPSSTASSAMALPSSPSCSAWPACTCCGADPGRAVPTCCSSRSWSSDRCCGRSRLRSASAAPRRSSTGPGRSCSSAWRSTRRSPRAGCMARASLPGRSGPALVLAVVGFLVAGGIVIGDNVGGRFPRPAPSTAAGPESVTDDAIAAARWLKDTSGPGHAVARRPGQRADLRQLRRPAAGRLERSDPVRRRDARADRRRAPAPRRDARRGRPAHHGAAAAVRPLLLPTRKRARRRTGSRSRAARSASSTTYDRSASSTTTATSPSTVPWRRPRGSADVGPDGPRPVAGGAQRRARLPRRAWRRSRSCSAALAGLPIEPLQVPAGLLVGLFAPGYLLLRATVGARMKSTLRLILPAPAHAGAGGAVRSARRGDAQRRERPGDAGWRSACAPSCSPWSRFGAGLSP